MHYWTMYPFFWLSSGLKGDHSKPLSCFLHLPLILIISHLPRVWPELFPRAATASSQAWEARGRGLLSFAEKTGPIVAPGALGTAQMSWKLH